jgi:hypothetical protein
LNQLQTILQNQITKHGDHIFKNGTVVIPGEFSINSSIDYVRLSSIGNTLDVHNLIGMKIQNTSGLEALVVHAETATDTDPDTLFVSYTTSATDTIAKVFLLSDTISTLDGIYSGITVAPSDLPIVAIGKGSIATIQRGVYYINGRFVLCETQSIILDRYSNTPTYKIGFSVNESVVTSDDLGYDSLLDNAQGSYNYAAPGAHRYYIDLVLTALPIDTDSETFSELGRVADGVILTSMKNTEYSQLEKTFARRTYDESGDYTVKPFPVDVREHRNNDRDAWSNAVAYEAGDIVTNASLLYTATYALAAGAFSGVAPTHTTGIVNNWEQTDYPYYNRGIYSFPIGDSSKLAIGFEPGKAYVQGYEIEKLATTYIEVDKPRNILTDVASDNNASISTSVGSYVQVRDVHNINISANPIMSAGLVVSLYDSIVTTAGTLAGTLIGTCKVRGIQTESGTSTGTYCKMFIYDVNLIPGKDFARDVKSFYNLAAQFTANVSFDTYSVSLGTITTTSASNVVKGSGFSKSLKVGDYIYSAGIILGKVSTFTSDIELTLTANAATVVTNTNALRIQTQLNESDATSLVFPLPHYATKTVTDQNYYIVKSFYGIVAATNSLTVSESGSTFLPDASNYYITDSSGNSIGSSGFTVDTSIPATAKLNFTTLTGTYNIFATVQKTSTPKTKTLTSISDTFTTFNNPTISLSKTDCYKLVSIFMGSTNITGWYNFNDGQTDSYYNYGSISLKPSYPTPTSQIVVSYQYFAHGTGDYFDMNSYANTIDYSLIPYYGGINLRDVIDFRPRVDSFSLNMPKRGYNMSVDTSYYLARQDKISLDINGNFFDTKGSSSLNPGMPGDSSTGMALCTIMLAPYTFNTTSDVIITKIENKRYTMRDIGKLEKRIDNIEYYTSLSMLEQETSSLSITDSQGNDRFKNGFIVDNFTGHNIGDVSSPDYICAIDMENGELRPAVTVDNVNLLVNTSTSTNYKLYGDLVTLPLNAITPHVELAKNAYASRTENVNPFAVFTFLGNVKLNPSSDDWFEVNRIPDLITNVEGNYSNLVALANKTGLIGTVWNSWQNQWTGTPLLTSTTEYLSDTRGLGVASPGNLSVSDMTAMFGIGGGVVGGRFRSISVQTFATPTGQSRTGIKTTAVAKFDSQVVDDKILSVAMIPYMRSRNVLIQSKGLKPNTRFYPYFDDKDIASYCIPASIITYTPVSGTFDAETNSGINSTLDPVRSINGDTQVCLNIGDVITGSSSAKKAVVVGKERTVSNAGAISYKLFVMNVSGSFTSGETITGSISGAVGTYGSISVPSTFTTGSSGDLNLLFNIPNTDAVRFRTGSREFKLIDVSTATGAFSSKGIAPYTASGTIQTKQAHVVSTRNVEFVSNQVSDNQTIWNSSVVVSDSGWYDPLAQTFLVESKGGAFLSKVDLFFASKDGNIPVSIEIREVVNGYPGKTVLPFSRVTVKSEDVKLSSTSVIDWQGVSYPKYDTPTTISFPSPIYVKDKTEYALVILSDSNNYRVWISQMGDTIPDTKIPISEQPYLGVFFKSQNASTWTASQDQDLKFTIWRANFDTTVTGNLVLTNDIVSKVTLEDNPIQTLAGSSTIRVWHNNHGFKTGDSVTLSGATSTDTTITPALLNIAFTSLVSNPTLDSYTLVVGANATTTGYIGGSAVKATRNVRYETLQPNISSLGFPDTTANYSVITTELSSNLANTEESCIINDNNYYSTAKIVPSGITGKLNIKVAMKTNNPALTPIIDTHGASAIAIGNKIDSPVDTILIPNDGTTNFNIAAIDRVSLFVVTAGSFVAAQTYTIVSLGTTNWNTAAGTTGITYIVGSTFTASVVGSGTGTATSVNFTITTATTTIGTLGTALTIGQLYTITSIGTTIDFRLVGAASNTIGLSFIATDTGVTQIGTGGVASINTIKSTLASNIAKLKRVVPGTYIELAGTVSNNKKFLVYSVNSSNGDITVRDKLVVTETPPATSNLYYYNSFFDEMTPVGSSTFSKYVSKVITLANQSNVLRIRYAVCAPTSSDVLVYYKTGTNGTNLSTSNWTLLAPDKTMPKTSIGSNTFYDVDYTAELAIGFDILTVKLVMKSTNTAAVPRVKDLRIIACAK